MKGRGLDALLVSDISSIRYLSGFTGSSAFVVIMPDKRFFLTDTRYATQAKSELFKGFQIRIYRKNGLDEVLRLLKASKAEAVGFEGDRLSYDSFKKLDDSLKGVKLASAPELVRGLRKIKDTDEIGRVRESIRILDLGFKEAQRRIRAGAVENAVALSIERAFIRHGADCLAFDTIIASGFRSALPHGKASGKKIKNGEFVVVDMGARLNGYNSDETRTYCVGRAGPRQKKIYQTVLDAQQRAIDSIRPGRAASAVDAAARGHIKKAGYGRFFGHALGHGVGIDVHEAPTLSPFSKDVLEAGMVVTVEPGIYIPDEGGVRIEDMVLVTESGCEVLTKTPREFICL